MVSFIQRTRLVQTADPVTREQIEPTVVRTINDVVVDRADLNSRLTPAQRNALGDLGAYELRYDLQFFMVLDVLGVRHDGARVFCVLYDVWPTRSSRDAGDPPVWQNSHQFQFSQRPGADQVMMLRRAIQDAVIEVSIRGGGGDERDHRLRNLVTKLPSVGNPFHAIVDALDGLEIEVA